MDEGTTSQALDDDAAPPSRGGRVARGSIRTPLVLAIVLGNVAAFLALLVAVQTTFDRSRDALVRETDLQLTSQIQEMVDAFDQIRAEFTLAWRGWRHFDDVLVVQEPRRDATGRWRVDGVYLNPIGVAQRGPSFDEQRALEQIARAVASDSTLVMGDEQVIPIRRRKRTDRPWGAVLVRTRPALAGATSSMELLPFFGLTVLGLTLALLVLLRRRVLDPVTRLAAAARQLEAGDMSARVELDDKRRDELGLLGDRFNDMAARMERYNGELEEAVDEATARVRTAEAAAMTQRRLASTGELAAGIAHELNNPLGGLMNAVEALKRPDLPETRRNEYLELISGGLSRMGETVGRLLRLSPREATLADVPLGRPLLDAIGLVRHRAQGAGVSLRVLSSHGSHEASSIEARAKIEALPSVRGSANELGQAFLNLLVNAVDAIEEARAQDAAHGGASGIEIDLRGTRGEGPVTLVFSDDGAGIDDKLLARVADPFFTTKEQGKGTGLGLAIVHNIVSAHAGRVLLEGRAGRGLMVTIELPRPELATPGQPGAVQSMPGEQGDGEQGRQEPGNGEALA